MPDDLTVCEEAARAGGKVLRNWSGSLDVRFKGRHDLVTAADLASQEAIRQVVASAFPGDAFIGEEGDAKARTAGRQWIVDPLDGTSNFARGIPHYAVSIALAEGNRLLAGVVYDPMLDECYSARRGAGARLNGRPMAASGVSTIDEAMVAVSFPANVDAQTPAVREFLKVLPICQGLRRGGSAALNLAYVAAGRFDVFWAWDLFPWDAAAGALLVCEAAGVLTAPDGGDFDLWAPRLLAASTGSLHREFGALLRNARVK